MQKYAHERALPCYRILGTNICRVLACEKSYFLSTLNETWNWFLFDMTSGALNNFPLHEGTPGCTQPMQSFGDRWPDWTGWVCMAGFGEVVFTRVGFKKRD